MPIRLLLFGQPQVEFDGQVAALAFERRSQLLVLLALKRAWIGRAELAGLFWPDLETRLAYTNLRKVLFRFQSFPWSAALELRGGAARFQAETDVHAFERALGEHRLDDALAHRRGELLAGFDDGESDAWSNWLHFERDRLRVEWRGAALQRLAADDLAPAAAIDLATQLLADDPLDEAAVQAQMRWLARDGQGARARQTYHAFAERLAAELGLVPGAASKALWESFGARTEPGRPPAPAVDETQDDGFVGRALELRQMAALLAQDDCRLLTLLGPGGVGKSRLARRALATLRHRFPDGAVFVALEAAATSSGIGAALVRDLGIEPTASAVPLDRAIEFLRERRMLLALDNFEHLTGDASIIGRLLQACPGLKLVVTSRARLAIAPEWLLPLDGLPWPEREDEDRAESFDAVRLFTRSARRVNPTLSAAKEMSSIIEICRRVDGLPLALELAAGWTRVLSCAAIANELQLGSEVLRAADAVQGDRHASIEAVFDQSWRLLSDAERAALARLSVFHGGFAAESARDVAAASLPVLAALADKSLVRKNDARLSLHPLVQRLAGLRLSDSTATRESAERAHALHFHRLLAQLRHRTANGDRAALQQVEDEFDNCRRAWRWAVRNGAVEALKNSTSTLSEFVDHRGRLEDALELLRDAAALPAAQDDPAVMARFAGAIAHIQYRLDRHADAEATALGALSAARVGRDRDAQALAFNVLGSSTLRRGRPADAKRFFAFARRRAVASGNRSHVAALLDNQALAEKALGHYDEALRLSLQSLEQHRDLGDATGQALCLNNLAVLYLVKVDRASAKINLHEGLAICDRHGIVGTRALILANLAEIALAEGGLQAAEEFGARALEAARIAGNRALASYLELHFVRVALERNDLAQARRHLGAALSIAATTQRQPLFLAALVYFGDVLAAQGERQCARLVWTFAVAHPSVSVPEREEIRARLAKWPAPAGAEPPWPGLELEEVVHRIVAEAGVAHAPLIAQLRG